MSFRGWQKTKIRTPEGIVDGIAPVIISASRATDIPAFYSDWFMDRLNAGYVKWSNPFNGKPQYVSLEKARVIVFCTKNPAPLMKRFDEIEKKSLNYYFSFTLNDYEADGIERNVPPLEERLNTFKILSDRLGPERVLWRFDPLILTDTITMDRLLDKVAGIANRLKGCTKKLIISFLDINRYVKVRRNLKAAGFTKCREVTPEMKQSFAASLQAISRGWGIEIAACAEELDLSACGISHNSCIDGFLMERVFSHDTELMAFLKPNGGNLFQSPKGVGAKVKLRKDPGQRKDCECIPCKDIGHYDTCIHGCIYCYANTSPVIAARNYGRHVRRGMFADSIV